MIITKNGIIRPKGDIHKISESKKFKDFAYSIYAVIEHEPMRKHWARHGVKQSDLNYGRVK